MYQDVSDEVKDQNDHLSRFGTISIPTCGNIPATLLRQKYGPALSEHVTYIVNFNMLTYGTKQLHVVCSLWPFVKERRMESHILGQRNQAQWAVSIAMMNLG